LPDTLKYLWPAVAALVIATVVLAWTRQLRRTDILLWVAALAGVAAAGVGYSTRWRFSTPTSRGSFFPWWRRPCCRDGCCCMRSTIVAGWWLCRPARFCWPGLAEPAHHATAARGARSPAVRHCRRRTPARSPARRARDIFIPFHTYYGALAGKRTFVHRMGIRDAEMGLGRPEVWTRHCRISSSRPSCSTGRHCRANSPSSIRATIGGGRCAKAWIRCACSRALRLLPTHCCSHARAAALPPVAVG